MASTQLELYKIHVLNFLKHNSTLKKGHKATLISNNFCTDSKLGLVPLSVRWMFLGIVLTCGDFTSDTVEMNEKQLRELLESSWSVPRALDSLQEIQVLTYAKIDLFLNRIEKNRSEEKVKEKNTTPSAFDFEIPYATYPLKKGKTPGFKKLSRDVKTEVDFENLKKASINYAEETKLNNTPQQFIKHFSTFANQWRDWVDFVPSAKGKSAQPLTDHFTDQYQRLVVGAK